ncbi:hypothetical protein SAMN05660359_04489 [Geodermatophilus obscurus]|uniref:Uncharacterized protein n=1 Tax=Geodermatophilus obscurus TaxID=1861 RepID=A0A1I5ICC0_9ACTN|nr:hypothetical protein SAMN05660359_04489 [Geodermatophilus obscurus]
MSTTWLTAMPVEAAGSIGRMKGASFLAARHARPTSRRGRAPAQVPVAHSTLKNDEPYRDRRPDWVARRNDEAQTCCMVTQLERLGHTGRCHCPTMTDESVTRR